MEQKNKLFIGNLSAGTSSEALKAICEEFGKIISANVVHDKKTSKAKGFGYVTFESEDCAASALEALDGINCDGKNIRVSFFQKK